MNKTILASRATVEALRLHPENLALAEAVHDWLASGDSAHLRQAFDDHQDADIAQVLAGLDTGEALAALRLLSDADRARIFGYLPEGCQVELARALPRGELAGIVAGMSHDERADLYKSLDEEERDDLLPALARAEREDLRKLAAYPEGTAGSVMTSDYAVLSPDLDPAAALAALRRQAPDSETVYQSYIVDDARRLIGSVALRELLIARSSETVGDVMERNVVRVDADAPRETAAQLIARYDLIALPVVDAEGRLVGIVTQDDAMDVAEAEATEDFHHVGTVRGLVAGVREATIAMLYRARVFWLVLLVFANLFSGAGIAYFEDTIAAHLALIFFLPLLIASGGNAGSQASTLMVRALATGDVRFADWGYLIAREAAVAALLGVTMAIAISFVGLARGGTEIAAVVSLAMVAIVIVGSLIGMSLPFLLARLKLDPATSSGPLVTSIADIAGVLIYFSIAAHFLSLEAPA